MQNFKISIPTPCHENWQEMTPQEQGRFCGACSKVVIDFTQMSEEEIIQFFQKHQNQAVCGRAKKTQLNRIYKHQKFLEKHYIHVYENYRKSWIGNKYLAILSFALLITGCQNPETQLKNSVHTEIFKHVSDFKIQGTKQEANIEIESELGGFMEIEVPPTIEVHSLHKEIPYIESELGGVMVIEPIPTIDSLEEHKTIEIDTIFTENLQQIADSSSSIISNISSDFSGLNIYPNPVQDKATIKYFLKENSDVKIYLLDNNGRLVKAFLHETQKTGDHRLDIDVEDLPSGVYFYAIETTFHKESKRLVISK